MDVNIPQPLPGQLQNNTQPLNATTQAQAVRTEQTLVDNVVTATTDTARTDAREQDALRRPARQALENAVPSSEDLALNGLTTNFGYDNDNNVIYLEIKFNDTDEVFSRIPSEELVEFLNNQSQRREEQRQAANIDPRDQLDQSI